MFHSQINDTIVVFSEKWTFQAHIDFCGSVPLISELGILTHFHTWTSHSLTIALMWNPILMSKLFETISFFGQNNFGILIKISIPITCSVRPQPKSPQWRIWAYGVLARWAHYEIAVSFSWVCNSHSEATAITAWWVIRWSHEYLTASSQCEFEVFWCFLFFSVENDKHSQANS